MKVKEGFVLRKVGNEQIVVTLGAAMKELNGLIRLNESGVLLWHRLEAGAERADLEQALTDAYGIPREQAARDVGAFLDSLEPAHCLE